MIGCTTRSPYVPHSNTMKKYEKHTQNSNTVQAIRLYQSFKRNKNINPRLF
jgi:hypothetical protein